MGPRDLGERVTVVETKLLSVATAAQVATLQAAVQDLAELNTRQHSEMADRLFGAEPTSLQSQITGIKESTIGDSPVSLRSRITAREQDNAVSRGKLALLVAIITGLVTFCAIKFQTIAGWFGYVPHAPTDLHNMLPKPSHGAYAFYVRADAALRSFIARLWMLMVFVLCVVWPKMSRFV